MTGYWLGLATGVCGTLTGFILLAILLARRARKAARLAALEQVEQELFDAEIRVRLAEHLANGTDPDEIEEDLDAVADRRALEMAARIRRAS